MKTNKSILIQQINALTNKVNSNIKELEKTKYSESSYAYDKLEQQRFDKMSYLTKSGYFKTANRSMTVKELEHELNAITKYNSMKSSSVEGIKKSLEQARQSFNKSFLEENPNRKRGLSRKQYAKLRHDFAEFQESNLLGIVTSDVIVDLSTTLNDDNFEKFYEFVTTQTSEENISDFVKETRRTHGKNLKNL